MRTLLRILVLLALLSVELYAVYAVLHPHVSPDYRAYYIDRTLSDWNPSHYPATPEQGIVFAREGWPEFVRNASGFSLRQNDGRWTDAATVQAPTIFMNQQFSGPICVELTLVPALTERGHKLEVALGSNVGEIMLSNPGFATYYVSFDDAGPADTLQFRFDGRIPRLEDVAPGSRDVRRLGIDLSFLRILPSRCSQVQAQP